MQPMRWEFFFGACFLTGALLGPHASLFPVVGGMALAGLIRIAWYRIRGVRGERPRD